MHSFNHAKKKHLVSCPDSEQDSSSSSYSFTDPVLERMRKQRIDSMVEPLLSGNENQDDIINLNKKRGYLLKYSKHYRHEQILDANEKTLDELSGIPDNAQASSVEDLTTQRVTLPRKKKKSCLAEDNFRDHRRVSFSVFESSDSDSFPVPPSCTVARRYRQQTRSKKLVLDSMETLPKFNDPSESMSTESRSPRSSPEPVQGTDYFSLSTVDHELNSPFAGLQIEDDDTSKTMRKISQRKGISRIQVAPWLSKIFHFKKEK